MAKMVEITCKCGCGKKKMVKQKISPTKYTYVDIKKVT